MSDIPDFMREFDTSTDYGFTPVSSKPADDSKPSVGKEDLNTTNLEISKVKSDVSSIKSMMNEIMQIVSEKESVNKRYRTQMYKKDLKRLKRLYYHSYTIFQSPMNLIYIGLIEDQSSRLRWTNC